MTKSLPDNLFPDRIRNLICAISKTGFFDRSALIGSWVMPIYQELYGIRYVLRTLDIDFAVHIAHKKIASRADLNQCITDLGFVWTILLLTECKDLPVAVTRWNLSDKEPEVGIKASFPFRNGT